MNIGNAYVLCKMCKIKVETKNKKKSRKLETGKTQAIPLNFGTGFSQLVPANTNRSTTFIENLTNCKQTVYFQFGLTATKRMLYHRACLHRPLACAACGLLVTCGSELTIKAGWNLHLILPQLQIRNFSTKNYGYFFLYFCIKTYVVGTHSKHP